MAEYQLRYTIVQQHSDDDSLVSLSEAARLTGMTPAAIRRCRAEGMVQAATLADDSLAFDAASLRRLGRIARLQADLELNLASVEIVLHMRDQMREMQRQMDALHRLHQQREDELLATIRDLRRRFAADAVWRE